MKIVENYQMIKSDDIWIGQYPKNWQIFRLKDKVQVNPPTKKFSSNTSGKIEFLPMSNVDEAKGQIKRFVFEDYQKVNSGYTAFKNDDVLFAKITPCMENGNCVIVKGLKNKVAFGSTEFIVFRAKRCNISYLFYYLRNHRLLLKAEKFMIGAAGQKRISADYLKNHPLLFPPLNEQNRISEYLDNKTTAIDKKIGLLEQKVTYYQELRKSLINKTVCRGLDKNVKLKDSSVEWIGMIPEHWSVKRGKAIFSETSIKGFPNEPLLAASQKQGIILKSMLEQKSMTAQKGFENFKLVTVGDFVISLRSFEGGIEIAYYRGIISPVYTVFKSKNGLCNDYMKYLFKSASFIQYLKSRITGIRDGQAIKFKEIETTLFPILSFKEQEQIGKYLDDKTSKTDQIISNIQNQIEALKELRKTLINDVVTGKIKVTENHE